MPIRKRAAVFRSSVEPIIVRKRVLKSCIELILIYGSESWTIVTEQGEMIEKLQR